MEYRLISMSLFSVSRSVFLFYRTADRFAGIVVDLDGKGADITSGTVGIAGSRFSVLIVEVQLSVQDRVVSLFLCFVDLVLCAPGSAALYLLVFLRKARECVSS